MVIKCVLDIPIQLLIEATRNAENEALIFPLEFYARYFDYKFVMILPSAFVPLTKHKQPRDRASVKLDSVSTTGNILVL
jgi:hypothetical protein